MNLRNIDLNLLVVLEALLSERSVSRAGEQIGLTQPAMSAALGRLRLLFDDPLLIRVGRGLELTRKADAVALPLRAALATADHTLAQNSGFDPPQDALHFSNSAERGHGQAFRRVLCRSCRPGGIAERTQREPRR